MLQQNGTNDFYLTVIVARMDTHDGLGNINIAINKTFPSICLVKGTVQRDGSSPI
jgi:hypothetical protein